MAAALTLILGACSGDADQPAETSSEPSQTPSPASTSSEAPTPRGPTLTSPGSQLGFGDTATVEYAAQQGRSATLDLTVRSAKKGALGDFTGFDTQKPQVRNANFYYVRVQVENAGTKRFGGAEVPLWGISERDTLLPPVIFKNSSFEQCPTEPLPRKFAPGDTFTTCLVFLAPRKGELKGVSYRPNVDFTPIEWTGKVEKAGATKSSGSKPSDED